MNNLSAARGGAPALDESSAWVRGTDGQPELDFTHVPANPHAFVSSIDL